MGLKTRAKLDGAGSCFQYEEIALDCLDRQRERRVRAVGVLILLVHHQLRRLHGGIGLEREGRGGKGSIHRGALWGIANHTKRFFAVGPLDPICPYR